MRFISTTIFCSILSKTFHTDGKIRLMKLRWSGNTYRVRRTLCYNSVVLFRGKFLVLFTKLTESVSWVALTVICSPRETFVS